MRINQRQQPALVPAAQHVAAHFAQLFLIDHLEAAIDERLLDAFLLAALMVFVYAGAVVALFLFIVMLLDTYGGDRKPFKKTTVVAGAFALALLVLGLATFAQRGSQETGAGATAAAVVPVGASLRAYGEQLFTTYLLPVQIVGFLLLIAMLGVIVLSKKFEGLEDVK